MPRSNIFKADRPLIGLATVIILTSCGSPEESSEQSFGQHLQASEVPSREGRIWIQSEETDPFTDALVSRMTASFEGERSYVDVEVGCNAQGAIQYRFTAFDKNDRPLSMSAYPNALERELGSNMVKRIDYRVRVDSQPPKRGSHFDPRVDNSFVIGTKPFLGGPTSSEIADGVNITLGVNYRSGDDVFNLDQSEPNFRDWINSCVGTTGPTSSELPTQQEAEDDYGGAVAGMAYDEFRRRFLSAGFKPEVQDFSKICAEDPSHTNCTLRFPETSACSVGAGEPCSYEWIKGEQWYYITTEGGEGGTVVSIDSYR